MIWSYMSYETSRLNYDVPLLCNHNHRICAGQTASEIKDAHMAEYKHKKEEVAKLCQDVNTNSCTENVLERPVLLGAQLTDTERNAHRCEGKVVGSKGGDFFAKAGKCCKLKKDGLAARLDHIKKMKAAGYSTCMKKWGPDQGGHKKAHCASLADTQAECFKQTTATTCAKSKKCQWGVVDNYVCPAATLETDCNSRSDCTYVGNLCQLKRCVAQKTAAACKVPRPISIYKALCTSKAGCAVRNKDCEPTQHCCPTQKNYHQSGFDARSGESLVERLVDKTDVLKVKCEAVTEAQLSDETEMETSLTAVSGLRVMLFERLAQAWAYLRGSKSKTSRKPNSQNNLLQRFGRLEMLPGTLLDWMVSEKAGQAVMSRWKAKSQAKKKR
jgi:hypothetical protein